MDKRKDVHPALAQPKKFLQLRDIPPDLHLAIKMKAVETGKTMELLAIEALSRVFLK